MTVLGIDISKWNGTWNAAKAKAAGAEFVFMKSSQSTWTDIRFVTNWQLAKSAGILRGAYHYLDYTKPAREQANYMADLLQNDPGDLPPVVDYEQKRSDDNTAAARAYLREFVETLKTRGYPKPIVYTSPGFWSTYGEKDNYWAQYTLWIAHYTTAPAPSVPNPWLRWTFWQFTEKGPGEMYGTESFNVDVNRFDGSLNDLYAFAGLPAPASLENRVAALEQRLTAVEQTLAGLDPTFPPPPDPEPEPNPEPDPGPEPEPVTELYAVCKASGLNVRSGPSTAYPVVGGLTFGQRVKVLERQNGWARLESPAGWSSERYLEFQSPNSDMYAMCTASGLNVRSGPGTGYPVVSWLTYGQRVKVLERQNNWARFDTPAGWSSEAYLQYL
jgi:lysozyme